MMWDNQKFTFIILTPFQYLCAIEYLKKYNLKKENCELILVSHLEKSVLQILDIGYLDSFHVIKSPMIGKSLIWLRLYKTYRLLRKSSTSNVVVGNLHNAWCYYAVQNAKGDKIILDDGTTTIPIAAQRRTGFFKISIGKKLNRMTFFQKYMMRPKDIRDRKLTFFTIFDHLVFSGKDTIVPHQLSFFHAQNEIEETLVDELWFLGTPLIKLGMIAEKDYFSVISHLQHKAAAENITFKYFAHRIESNLEQIKGIIVHNDEPLEIYFLNSSLKPRYIYSFYSNALFSLSKLGNLSRINAINISQEMRLLPDAAVWKNVDIIYDVIENTPEINYIKNLTQI